MAISCDPATLAKASVCYCYPEKKIADAVKIYLLYLASGSTLTPPQLAAAAKCYCYDLETAAAVQNYLLCQLVNK